MTKKVSQFGQELLEGLQSIKDHYDGKITLRTSVVETPDLRKIGLMNGLRQLSLAQLLRVRDYPHEMVLDTYNYADGKFCPLAVGVGLDGMTEPSQAKVYKCLEALGFSIYNTTGIEGEFYQHPNREADLRTALTEVIAEKQCDE